jgi:hypothetical protein
LDSEKGNLSNLNLEIEKIEQNEKSKFEEYQKNVKFYIYHSILDLQIILLNNWIVKTKKNLIR